MVTARELLMRHFCTKLIVWKYFLQIRPQITHACSAPLTLPFQNNSWELVETTYVELGCCRLNNRSRLRPETKITLGRNSQGVDLSGRNELLNLGHSTQVRHRRDKTHQTYSGPKLSEFSRLKSMRKHLMQFWYYHTGGPAKRGNNLLGLC